MTTISVRNVKLWRDDFSVEGAENDYQPAPHKGIYTFGRERKNGSRSRMTPRVSTFESGDFGL
jgi:hypothetical protein